ncbi:hypothetical protein [Paenibacillus amylolyticus]|uniref:hypothetical protein n=1 Tax=Paenibacillus amylolyticus TaxID=1451 RepID=UPI003D96C927
MSRIIKDDAEFKRAIQGMEKLTEELEDIDPLEDEEVIQKKKWMLTRTAELVQEYSRGKYAAEYPDLKAKYDSLGWSYQDFSPPAETPQTAAETNTPTEAKQAPKQPIEPQKTASKVSSWLDD